MNKCESIRLNPLLGSLGDSAIQKLAESSELLRVGSGFSTLPHSDANDEIYLIVEGQAKIEIVLVEPGHPGDGFDLGPGDLFGTIRFFDESLPRQTFVANTELVTLRWHSGDWRQICEQDTEIGYKLAVGAAKLVIQRVRSISIIR